MHDPVILVPAKPADEEMRRRAEKLFPLLQRSRQLGREQLAQKQAEWVLLHAGVAQAEQLGGELRVPTGNRNAVNHGLRRRVLAAAVDAEVLEVLPRANTNVRGRYVVGKNWK